MIRRVVFLGNNTLAVRVLSFLKTQPQKIVALVVHPHGNSKRRRQLVSMSGLSKDRILDGDEINQSHSRQILMALQPDMLVSVMFGYILKKEILSAAKYGAVNLHPAYLPYNRGAHPNVWSIVEGTPAGVTLHTIDAGVDTGKILAQEKVKVEPTDTGKSLYEKLEQAAYELFIKTWPRLVEGKLAPKKQQPGGSEHRVKDLHQLDEIDLDKKYTGKELINILRARTFSPYPGAHFKAGGGKIWVRVRLTAE